MDRRTDTEALRSEQGGYDLASRDPAVVSVIYGVARTLTRVLIEMTCDFRVRGARNVPRRGGVILASNHESYLDPILIGTALRRPTGFFARKSLYDNRFFGRLIWNLNAIPVSRDQLSPEALRRAVQALKGGWPLVVFPEGTRSADGRLKPLRRGLALLAARAAVPVVPIRVRGAYAVWPRHRHFPQPGRIRVAFGPPVVYDRRTDTYDSFTERMYRSLAGLGGGQ